MRSGERSGETRQATGQTRLGGGTHTMEDGSKDGKQDEAKRGRWDM